MTEKLEDRKIWGAAVQRRDACERRARFFGMHSVLVDGGFYEVDGANLAGLHFSVPHCFVMFGRRGDGVHRYRAGNCGERSAARCAGSEDDIRAVIPRFGFASPWANL